MNAFHRPSRRLALFAVGLLSGCLKASNASNPGNGTTPLLAPILETVEGARLTDLEFGTLVVGNPGNQFAALRNPNPTAVTVQVTGADSGPFAVSGADGVLQPGARVVFQVHYAPQGAGTDAAAISFTVADDVATTLLLTATAIDPPCGAIPPALDFGPVSVGGEAFADLNIANPLPIAWTLAVPAPSGSDAVAFQVDNAQTGLTLSANGSATVALRFAPARTGSHTGALTFALGGTCGNRSVALTGTGLTSVVQCAWAFDSPDAPCAVEFGFADVQQRVTRAIQFRNLGTADATLHLGALTQPDGVGAPFALITEETDIVLPAGGTPISVGVEFVPSTTGEQVAALAFTTTDPGLRAGSVALRGHGGGPQATVDPTCVTFRKILVGTSLALQVQVTNAADTVSGEPLRFGAYVDGTFVPAAPEIVNSTEFTVDAPSASTLAEGVAVGESVALTVHFNPRSAGGKTGMLRIHTTVSGGTDYEVLLSGEAIQAPPCNLQVLPATVDYGFMSSGTPRTRYLTLTNAAANAADACLVSVIPTAQSTVYELPRGAVDSVLVAGGESLVVPVQMQPRSADGAFSDSITVRVSNTASPEIAVPVVGEIGAMALMVSESALEFDVVGVNCGSGERLVTVYNTSTGGGSIPIDSIALQSGSSPRFTLSRLPSQPTSVGAGRSIQFAVAYSPLAEGEDTGSVLLSTTSYAGGIVIPLHGSGKATPLRTEVFPVATKRDVLMVLDNSGANAVDVVRQHASDLLATAMSNSVDFQLAATTTSLDSASYECGRFFPVTGTVPRIITPTTPSLTQAVQAIMNVGSYGSGIESLIRPAYLALSRPLVNGTNAGFLRPDADLRVLIISEAADQDPRAAPVTFYEDFLWTLKGRTRRDQFGVSAFVPLAPQPPATGCSYDSPNAGTDTRVKTLVQDTAGIAIEYCTAETSTAVLRTMSSALFGPQNTYFLNGPPDMTRTPNPVEATIDGQPFPATGPRGETRWQYDSTKNAVVFDSLSAPGPGSTLTITYAPTCL